MTNYENGCGAELEFINQFGGERLETYDPRQYKQDIDVVLGEQTYSIKDIKASKKYSSIALEKWQADEHKTKFIQGSFLRCKATHYAFKVWYEGKWMWCLCSNKELKDLVNSKKWKTWETRESTVQYNKSIGVKRPYTSGIIIPISELINSKFKFVEVL